MELDKGIFISGFDFIKFTISVKGGHRVFSPRSPVNWFALREHSHALSPACSEVLIVGMSTTR